MSAPSKSNKQKLSGFANRAWGLEDHNNNKAAMKSLELAKQQHEAQLKQQAMYAMQAKQIQELAKNQEDDVGKQNISQYHRELAQMHKFHPGLTKHHGRVSQEQFLSQREHVNHQHDFGQPSMFPNQDHDLDQQQVKQHGPNQHHQAKQHQVKQRAPNQKVEHKADQHVDKKQKLPEGASLYTRDNPMPSPSGSEYSSSSEETLSSMVYGQGFASDTKKQ